MFRKKQSRDVWFQKGSEAGVYLQQAVADMLRYLLEDWQPKNANSLLMFNVALFYIFLDFQAASYLDTNERSSFSDGLVLDAVRGVTDSLGGTPADWDKVGEILNKHMNKLAPYSKQLYAEPDKSPKGTLFWEYSKMLHSDFNVEPGKAATASIVAPEISIKLWKEVKHMFPKNMRV